jgi:hypothetical protein
VTCNNLPLNRVECMASSKENIMRRLTTIAKLGGLSVIIGCNSTGPAPSAGGAGNDTAGGGSGIQTTGGIANGGASTNGSGGTVAIGGGAGTSNCNYPFCLENLHTVCPISVNPLPSCISQQTTTGNITLSNFCYSDGTSISSTLDLTTHASTFIMKRSGSVCYSLETSVTLLESGMVASSSTTYKDASGNLIATQTRDVTSHLETVTCADEQPIVINLACDSSSTLINTTCQPGACNP